MNPAQAIQSSVEHFFVLAAYGGVGLVATVLAYVFYTMMRSGRRAR